MSTATTLTRIAGARLALAAAAVLVVTTSPVLAHDREKPADQHHAATIGTPGDPARASRTVRIAMDDTMRYTPHQIRVRRGETIRFVVTNRGRVSHELVLGSPAELEEHAALMRKFPGMEHADPNQVVVEPGATRELVWRFTRGGVVDFACLQPGHFEAGMRGKVSVR